ncbi:hypothetical protein BH11BAC7_BH11BAC7_12670 [soil metagenome]
MKAIIKLVLLTAFIACVSSCQKEKLLVPNGCSSHQQSAENQRISNSTDTSELNAPVIKTETDIRTDEIVGGGDDDRDGGGSGNGKKSKKD